MDLYREAIIDHYRHPRNFGELAGPTATGEAANATCGDKIRIGVNITGDRITDIRFSGNGCAISLASASMLTEKVLGMQVADVKKLTFADIKALLGTDLTPSRVRCATLPLEVLHRALTVQK